MSNFFVNKRRAIGYNGAVGTTLEDICELGVTEIPYPTGAIIMEVASSDGNDSPNGIGVREIHVHGLDGDFKEIYEKVGLNGITAVTLKQKFIRINNVHSTANGGAAPRVAQGHIYVRALGGGTVYNRISAGGNHSLQCHFTVPDNKVAKLVAWSAGIITTKKDTIARAILRATSEPYTFEYVKDTFLFHDIMTGQTNTVTQLNGEDIYFPGKTDIKISAQQMQGTGVTEASGKIVIEYIDIELEK